MPHLRGHKYLGPGTELKGQQPVDQDDYIAKEHDEAYARARTRSEVRAADRHAIHDFASNVVDTGNVHSALGALGLSVKYGIESIAGVLYPRVAGQ